MCLLGPNKTFFTTPKSRLLPILVLLVSERLISLLLGEGLDSLNLKAPVSQLHVRWKLICLRSTVTLREVCQNLSDTVAPLCHLRKIYCSLLLTTSHHFSLLFFIAFHCCSLLCTLLFATYESKRQKSKLSKFLYLSHLFNLLCCCRTGMDRERLHQPRRPVNQCTPVQFDPNVR